MLSRSLLATILACLSLAGTASGYTTTVSPGGAVVGTAALSSMFTVGGKSFICDMGTRSKFTATLANSVFDTISSNVAFSFVGCRIVGGTPVTIGCSSTASWMISLPTAGANTSGRFTNLSCTFTLTTTPICRVNVTGSLPNIYSNSGGGALTIIGANTLLATGSTCTATFPNGSARLTDFTGADQTWWLSPLQTITAV
jgi:hypothetical protein